MRFSWLAPVYQSSALGVVCAVPLQHYAILVASLHDKLMEVTLVSLFLSLVI